MWLVLHLTFGSGWGHFQMLLAKKTSVFFSEIVKVVWWECVHLQKLCCYVCPNQSNYHGIVMLEAEVVLLCVSSKSKQLPWYCNARSAVFICMDYVILCSSHNEQLCTKYILMSVQMLAVFLVVFSNIFSDWGNLCSCWEHSIIVCV